MHRVGILTLYYKNDNYGGIAQAYALQKYVEILGYDSSVICYRRTTSPMFDGNKIGSIQYMYSIVYKFPEKLKLKIKNFLARRQYYDKLINNIEIRKKAFERSRLCVKHTEIVYTDETIEDLESQFDCFVSGSDQIWKPIVVRPAYVCGFVPKNKKKISYASSIAATSYPKDYSEFMKNSLKDYDWISVREDEAKKFLCNILDKNIDVVVDPTLLLPFGLWNTMASERLIKDKYIFVYLLGQSEKQRIKIKEYAKHKRMQIVTLPHVEGKVRACDIDFGDIQLYDVTLNDFFSLIKNSEKVITDSFHAVVFSLVFKRDFFVYARESFKLGGSMVSRLNTLLGSIGLQQQLVDVKTDLNSINKSINYNKVYAELAPLIEKSQNLLKNALKQEDI